MRSGHGCRRGGRVGLGGIGNGPLNVVLDGRPGAALPAGSRFAVRECFLTVSDVTVDLARAVLWTRGRIGMRCVRGGRRFSPRRISPGGSSSGLQNASLLKQAGPAVAAAVAAFQGAWQRGAQAEVQSAICNLCGLGPGLTPAGDDWLAGWLLAQHLAPDLIGLDDLSGLITDAAAGRTTTLARTFLVCAAAGEADQDWHMLLQALAEDPMTNLPIYQSTNAILAHGATSGAAMLAGFFSGMATPDPCLLTPGALLRFPCRS